MAKHNLLGQQGEEEACNYLIKKGYRITNRNWRYKHKEIDIIAWDKETLVIVEVKTRSSDEWELPKEAITAGKIKLLIEATEAYLIDKDIMNEVRFDVLTILHKDQNTQIEHIKEAFHPTI